MPSSRPDDNDDGVSGAATSGVRVAHVGVSAREARPSSGCVDGGKSGLEADVWGSCNGYLKRHLS